jgi:hypothetical protein
MESCDKNRTRQRRFIKSYLTIELTSSPPTTHHTLESKKPYFQSMSGAPMGAALSQLHVEFYKQELISLEKIVEKCAIILLSSIV